MNDSNMSLYKFLNLENFSKEGFEQIKLSTEWREKTLSAVWPLIFNKVFDEFKNLFDFQIPHILVNAWYKIPELLMYSNKDQYPPDRIFYVTLINHSIESKHRPSIELTFNKTKIGEIKFDVELDLKIEGLELRIQGGAITGIRVGSCQGAGKISYNEIKFWETEASKIEIPILVAINPPIVIAKQI